MPTRSSRCHGAVSADLRFQSALRGHCKVARMGGLETYPDFLRCLVKLAKYRPLHKATIRNPQVNGLPMRVFVSSQIGKGPERRKEVFPQLVDEGVSL